jgi:DNA-binding transcriptional regulator YiaG
MTRQQTRDQVLGAEHRAGRHTANAQSDCGSCLDQAELKDLLGDQVALARGRHIRQLRMAMGLGIRSFAQALEVAPSTVWTWEIHGAPLTAELATEGLQARRTAKKTS